MSEDASSTVLTEHKYEEDFETVSSSPTSSSSDLTEVSSTSISTNTLHVRLRCYGIPLICVKHALWFDPRSRESRQIAAQNMGRHCSCPMDISTRNKRVNMSFSNEEMRKIARENEILLRKIMDHSRTRKIEVLEPTRQQKPSAYVNRMRQQQIINRENSVSA